MVDVQTIYIKMVYVVNQADGPYFGNSGEEIMTILFKPVKVNGQNITTENWYTSISLAQSVLKDNLLLVETMKKNREEIHFWLH